MSFKLAGGLLVAAILFAGASAAYSADLGVSRSATVYSSSRALGTRHTLGFWGENFPYGYRWSLARACRHREVVETPRGPRWRTVWVCRVSRYAAYE